MTGATTRDLHSEITNQLIAAIESNPGRPVLPWRKGGGGLHLPANALTGNHYRGINVVSLWVAAETRGYDLPVSPRLVRRPMTALSG